MNVLFEITHPAHVHLFRNAIAELQERGHEVLVTSRDKELTVELLDAYGIEHTVLSTKGDHKLSLATEWLVREARLLRVARTFRPDVVVGQLNPAAAHVATVLGATCVVFNDGENTNLLARVTNPFVDVICTPADFGHDWGPRQRRYDGYHELAYLHENHFTPDAERLRSHGVDPEQPYSVLRFISWGAYHDAGQHGLSLDGKRRLVDRLSELGPVYITSEKPLGREFEEHRLPVPPEMIHDLLAFATLYAGDSGTMATEAALLGTPAVRISTHMGSLDLSNFTELESEYGLLYSTADEEEALQHIDELLDDPALDATFERRRERLMAEKIDVTAYMVETILQAGGEAVKASDAATQDRSTNR